MANLVSPHVKVADGGDVRPERLDGPVARVDGRQDGERRWLEPSTPATEIVSLHPNEIVLVRGDPDRMEDGTVVLVLMGGRQ